LPWFKPHRQMIEVRALRGAAERIAQMHAAAQTLGNAAMS
jgi:hypothetical protein